MTQRFKELREKIYPIYPYKNRLVLKSSTNMKIFISRVLQKLGLQASFFGDSIDENIEYQKHLVNLYIIFSRVSTNTMIKAAFAHSLYSDTDFWNSLSLDFSNASVTDSDFKEWISSEIITLSLGWAEGKVITATGNVPANVANALRISELSQKLKEKLRSDIRWILSDAASDLTIDLTLYVDYPVQSSVIGDGYLDTTYQDLYDKRVQNYLNSKGIQYTEEDLAALKMNFFKPNNDPENPHSTIYAEKSFVEIEVTPKTIITQDEVLNETVVSTAYYYGKTHENPENPSYRKDTGWFIEWSPSQKAGVVHAPVDLVYPAKLPIFNILSIQNYEATEHLETYLTGIHYLPLSSSHLVVKRDFQISRQVILARAVTLGSKYIQALTENFPQFSLVISVVRFGKMEQRVLNFLNAVITFMSNPRKYPGSMYIYDSTIAEVPTMDPLLYRKKVYKKYEVIPVNMNKRVNADNNTIVDITLSGLVVGGHENR